MLLLEYTTARLLLSDLLNPGSSKAHKRCDLRQPSRPCLPSDISSRSIDKARTSNLGTNIIV